MIEKLLLLNNYLSDKKTILLILLNVLLIIFVVLEVSILYNINGGIKGVESQKMRDICVGNLC